MLALLLVLLSAAFVLGYITGEKCAYRGMGYGAEPTLGSIGHLIWRLRRDYCL